ncbi:hypothetical protein BRD00_05270 [Halobacteriales archaeon QS_8_69_26]|nr:MAG: hypothetical protein BRD00_05270 [Halobacteriales archaeon QS_8_69_26]
MCAIGTERRFEAPEGGGIGLVVAATYFDASAVVGTVVGGFQYTHYAVLYRDLTEEEVDTGSVGTADESHGTGGAEESPFSVHDW